MVEGAESDAAALRPVYVQAHVSLAVCYTEKGMFRRKDQHFNRAAQIDPQNVRMRSARWGYVSSAQRHGRLRRLRRLKRRWRATLAAPALRRAWRSWRWSRGGMTTPSSSCQEAICADPTHEQAYVELAGALQLAGRHAEALEALQKAVSLNPKNLEYLLRAISPAA